MRSFFNTISSSFSPGSIAADFLMAIPRVVGGLILSIQFGSSKFGMPWTPSDKELALFEVASWFPEDIANFGAPFSWSPWFFAWMAAASEAIGGILLAIGFKTRFTSFLIACTMIVAIFFQKWDSGVWSMLPAMGFLWISIQGMVHGSGRFGLDSILHRVKLPRFRKGLAILSIPLALSICSFTTGGTATITIPPKQEFLLGELADHGYSASVKNLGTQIIEVKIISKTTGKQTQGFGLSPKGETRISVSKDETVIFQNPSNEEATVKVKLRRNVEGMRYQDIK